MIIACENCSKKFTVQNDLIPNEGRLLQCSNCNHKWFFKPYELNNTNKIEPDEHYILSKKLEINIQKDNDLIKDEKQRIKISQNEKNLDNNKSIIKKKNPKIIKNFLVLIISIVAVIILLDTFKYQLNNYIPGINSILNNLYETLKDLSLFFKDLID